MFDGRDQNRRQNQKIMKNGNSYLLSVAASLALIPAFSAFGQKSVPTIVIQEYFDFPRHGLATGTARGINKHGDIVGWYQTISSEFGFIHYRNNGGFGSFAFPDATQTLALDINDSRTVCGLYVDAESEAHGFFQIDGVFSSFDVEGAMITNIQGINDAGDFVGGYVPEGGSSLPYADIAGVVTTITIPDATSGVANAISSNGIVVGNYHTTAGNTNHGFIRDADGNLTEGFDYPGAESPGTFFSGVNSRGWIVGNYWTEVNGYGFFLKPPNSYVQFSIQNADSTYLTGINDHGQICGYYVDDAGAAHSFLAYVSFP
jgi:hypothetical protein